MSGYGKSSQAIITRSVSKKLRLDDTGVKPKTRSQTLSEQARIVKTKLNNGATKTEPATTLSTTSKRGRTTQDISKQSTSVKDNVLQQVISKKTPSVKDSVLQINKSSEPRTKREVIIKQDQQSVDNTTKSTNLQQRRSIPQVVSKEVTAVKNNVQQPKTTRATSVRSLQTTTPTKQGAGSIKYINNRYKWSIVQPITSATTTLSDNVSKPQPIKLTFKQVPKTPTSKKRSQNIAKLNSLKTSKPKLPKLNITDDIQTIRGRAQPFRQLKGDDSVTKKTQGSKDVVLTGKTGEPRSKHVGGKLTMPRKNVNLSEPRLHTTTDSISDKLNGQTFLNTVTSAQPSTSTNNVDIVPPKPQIIDNEQQRPQILDVNQPLPNIIDQPRDPVEQPPQPVGANPYS